MASRSRFVFAWYLATANEKSGVLDTTALNTLTDGWFRLYQEASSDLWTVNNAKDEHMRRKLIPGLVCFFFLAGCGVTLESKRIADGKPTTLIPNEGIVYALPKTEFVVAQTVKLKVPTSGVLQDVFDGCTRACDAAGTPDVKKACTFSLKPSLNFSVPELRTVSTPDSSRLYQISPSADIFQSLDFKFEIAANGVLEKADSSATNLGYEVGAAFVNAAIKIGAMAANGPSPLKLPKPATAQRTCYQVSSDVADLADQESGTLSCSLSKEVSACMAPFDRAVEGERAELDAIFKEARSQKTDVKLLAALTTYQRQKIDTAKSKRDEAAARYGFGESAPKEASFQVVVPMGAPAEFKAHTQSITLGSSVVDGTSRILGLSDNASSLLPAFLPLIKDAQRHYVITSTMPPDVAVSTDAEARVVGNGYRYRVPVTAQTTLAVFESPAAGSKLVVGPLRDGKVVAQYGPIAALPSNFKGKQGRVMVKHWPETGGLQTVEIGAEGIPTSAVTGVVDELVAQRKARKDKADTAAAAAAAADPELDALTRQEKVLALKKQIKDLEESLNK